MRRALAVLLTVAALLATLTATTSAAPDTAPPPITKDSGRVFIPPGDVSAQAWECNAGDLCVWNNTDATSPGKCSWTNRDNDWRYAPVVCSWSANPVYRAYNNGTNSNYSGVNLYLDADYTNFETCIPQGWKMYDPGTVFRSHRWTTGTCVVN